MIHTQYFIFNTGVFCFYFCLFFTSKINNYTIIKKKKKKNSIMLLVPWSSQDSDWMTRLFSVAVDNSLCCECMVFFFISSYQYSIIGVSLSNHKGSPDVHQRCCTSRSTPRSGPRAQVSEHTPTCACIIQHYHKFSAKIRSLPKLKRVLQFFLWNNAWILI